MALDTTVAGALSNSYLSVADADAYAADDLGRDVTAWTAATTEQKENALIQATLDVDEFSRRAGELPYDSLQALRYPRDTDVTGDPAAAFLPVRLKRATYEQAKYRLANADLFADARARRARGLASFADDDGSGTMSLRPDLERWSDRAKTVLEGLLATSAGGPTLVSVPMASGMGDVVDATGRTVSTWPWWWH